MGTESDAARSGPANFGGAGFREAVCLTALLEAQNSDGGWAYHPSLPSATEPTAWALLALSGSPALRESPQALFRARDWLLAAQLPDGSWPSHPIRTEGCWMTSLVCIALQGEPAAAGAISRALKWLCKAWPGEGRLWMRWAERLFSARKVVRQNSSLRGWSWTPGTSSWVEPTAWGLLLIRSIYDDAPPPGLARRRRLAEAMLYDRMCPDGGWNSGNPVVYGVAGEPLIGPTAWALLALRHQSDRRENQKSLDWLEQAYGQAAGPGSLAVAHLCLRACGRAVQPLETVLQQFYGTNRFLGNSLVLAQAAVALGPIPKWLGGAASGGAQE